MDPKFGEDVDNDDIPDEFEGQGHRSMVIVAKLKNVIFELSGGLTVRYFVMLYGVMWRDVIGHHSVTSLESLGKNTEKEGTMQEGRQRSGVFIGERSNLVDQFKLRKYENEQYTLPTD